MGSYSEKFVPFYKTGDVTSRNPVILTTTSVTTLNLTVSITIVGKNLHFKFLW